MKGNFLNNLAKATEKQKRGALMGMKLGAAAVKEESQVRSPVDSGNLKGSHYTQVEADSKGVTAKIGTTADYAIYVHENLEANFTVGEAKFLENSLQEKSSDVLRLVKKMAGV